MSNDRSGCGIFEGDIVRGYQGRAVVESVNSVHALLRYPNGDWREEDVWKLTKISRKD